ncbi:hypothetical protein ACFJIX_16660 [Roseateles sp. UC29_93]|uniref:hypothetical protein n=1 Tax=Roseateles sp. UC29_93 TaxID=3350177 RepID=UPI00366F7F0A
MDDAKPTGYRVIGDANVDKIRLRILAVNLEQSLDKHRTFSPDVARLAEYAPLKDAMRRAEEQMIDLPEELGNLGYWLFETELSGPDFVGLIDCLIKFDQCLKGWRVIEE